MEEINGISFKDWACACGNLTQGMPEEEICTVLGVEMPVWKETTDKWAAKLGDLMAEDMNIATQYGDYFANPKQGKFASTGSQVTIDELLVKVPDYDAYMKIHTHQAKANDVGIDPVSIIESYGLNLGTWGMLNMHYMKWRNEFTEAGDAKNMTKENYEYFTGIHNKWDKHFTDLFANEKVDLGDDISF